MFYLLLIVVAVISRLIPHVPNIAPIGALALFIGVTALNQKQTSLKVAGFLVPIVALAMSDALIGFYSGPVMVAVYASYILTMLIGLMIHKQYRATTILGATLSGSILFYLITNAAVWLYTPMYAKTLQGLGESYMMALPFFRNSLVGDLIYTGALFAVYELALRPIQNRKTSPAISHV